METSICSFFYFNICTIIIIINSTFQSIWSFPADSNDLENINFFIANIIVYEAENIKNHQGFLSILGTTILNVNVLHITSIVSKGLAKLCEIGSLE